MPVASMPMTNSTKTEPRDLFRGALEMMIFESLRRQPMHGYSLVQHIKQRSNELLQVEEGSLYPAMQRMLRGNLVKAAWEISASNRKVRTYRITPAGVRHLEREVSRFEQMLKGINLVLAPKESWEATVNWLRQLIERRQIYRDLNEEIEQHLSETVEESGVSEDARRSVGRPDLRTIKPQTGQESYSRRAENLALFRQEEKRVRVPKRFRHLSPAIDIKQNVLTVDWVVKIGGSWLQQIFLPSPLDHSNCE
jgi:PadR family transcriptional regulator PadR